MAGTDKDFEIVITGAGIVSAIGIGKAETLQSLLDERTGVAPLRYLRTDHREFLVGEVKLTDEEMKQRLGINVEPTTRISLMGMMALEEALAEAGLWSYSGQRFQALQSADGSGQRFQALQPSRAAGQRIALISGTTVGGMDKSEQFYLDFLDNDSRNDYILTHDCGSTTELIASHFQHPLSSSPLSNPGPLFPSVLPTGLFSKPGPLPPSFFPTGLFSLMTTPSTACSSAANAFVMGANLLRSGMADVAVAGGAECISRFHLNGFNSLMIIDHGQCRPFDADRAGLNLGEGAAYMVLETADHARRRNAQPLARLAGYGNACDAFHQTASSDDGEGAFLAMQKALRMAHLLPSDIDYVNAHGTGTPNNDASESQALRRLFGKTIPPISSTKGMTGHTTSASGSVEAVICLLALRHGFLPANYGFTTPMPDGITPVAHVETGRQLHHVLCNSFGFGGNDTSIILSRI